MALATFFLCLNFLTLVFDVITLKYFEPFYGIEETIYTNNNFVSTLDIKELRFSFVVQCRIIEDIAMTLLLCSHPWPSWENLNICMASKNTSTLGLNYIQINFHFSVSQECGELFRLIQKNCSKQISGISLNS